MRMTPPVERLSAEDRGWLGRALASAVIGEADDPFAVKNPLTPEQWQTAAERFLHSYWCAELSPLPGREERP